MASISLSPISFFANFAIPSPVKWKFLGNEQLTESTPFYFLRRQAKHSEYLCQYLHEYIEYRGGQRNLFGVNMKASEEIPHACKEIEEVVITCTDASGSLI